MLSFYFIFFSNCNSSVQSVSFVFISHLQFVCFVDLLYWYFPTYFAVYLVIGTTFDFIKVRLIDMNNVYLISGMLWKRCNQNRMLWLTEQGAAQTTYLVVLCSQWNRMWNHRSIPSCIPQKIKLFQFLMLVLYFILRFSLSMRLSWSRLVVHVFRLKWKVHLENYEGNALA